jgi:hypothetical protein
VKPRLTSQRVLATPAKPILIVKISELHFDSFEKETGTEGSNLSFFQKGIRTNGAGSVRCGLKYTNAGAALQKAYWFGPKDAFVNQF